MGIPFKDLPDSVRRKLPKIKPVNMTVATISQHALAVAAMLRDDRGLTPSQARRVLKKALQLV